MNPVFADCYRNRRVLVTGHTGFKGSWLCLWLESLGAEVWALSLPPETDPSHWALLGLNGTRTLDLDLRDAVALDRAVNDAQPEVVFHLAAQSLVRRSYRAPEETFATNVGGLVNLLESVRRVGSVRALVNVTTDKVYHEPPPAGSGYRETDPLGGHDPYSTSKACAELVTDSYRKSFLAAQDCRVATARAGNVIGGGDWAEDRLVPDLVRAATRGEPLHLRNPGAVRPWQHVLEPLAGYLRLGQKLLEDDSVVGAWNFGPGGDATLTVQAMALRMKAHWPELDIVTTPGPHPHEAALLTLDSNKASMQLGWQPVWDAATTIEHTMAWYRDHRMHGRIRSRDDLEQYVADARSLGVDWAT